MTDEKELIATKAKAFRGEKKPNQFDFAKDCEISKKTISLSEREQANVRLDTVQLLASRMGITVPELFSLIPVIYVVIPEEIIIEGKAYTIYGIGAIKNFILIDRVPNVSLSLNKANSLVQLCNENNVSPIHLRDVIEDATS